MTIGRGDQYAGAFEVDKTEASTAVETVIDFGHNALGGAAQDALFGWIDWRSFVRLTLEAEALGAAGCDFTVEARTTRGSTTFDLQAPFTVAAGTVDRTTVSKVNTEEIGYIRVLKTGTNTQNQRASVLGK